MYLTDRFSQLLRCEVALHYINVWDINDLTFNYYWKKLQLPVWRYVCVTHVFVRVALYLNVTHSTCKAAKDVEPFRNGSVHEFYRLKALITLEHGIDYFSGRKKKS